MMGLDMMTASLQRFVETNINRLHVATSSFLFQGGSLLLLFLILSSVQMATNGKDTKQPPMLREKVPYLHNIIQYTTDMGSFLSRAT